MNAPGDPARGRARRIAVLYLVPDLGVGGAERHVTTLMPRLDPERFEPMVMCIGQEGGLFADLVAAGVPARALHRTRRQMAGTLVDLVKAMRSLHPDIVIVRGFNAEVLGRIGAAMARVPAVVVWVHNCGEGARRAIRRRALDRLLGPMTDAYFGVAEAQRKYLIGDLGIPARKVTIIENGVDPASIDPSDDRGAVLSSGVPPDAMTVGIVAALRPEKDHALFLRAAARVASVFPRARFIIIGDGPLRTELETQAQRNDIADRVVFTGARSDVDALLRGLDVFVLCSYTVECFPMALLEAMAAGRAAVCTAVGGVPELLVDGKTGSLVPAHDPAALADRIIALLSDDALRARFGREARARVETRFGIERCVERTEESLCGLVGTGAGRRRPVRLALILDETSIGGAETLMLELFRRFDPAAVQATLICLRSPGPLADDFRSAGIDVDSMGRRGWYDPRTLPRLIARLRRGGADAVLVTHHHRASLALGRLAAVAAGVPVNLVAVHDMDLTAVGRRCLPKWAVNSLFLSSAMVLLSPRQGEYLRCEEGVGARPWSRTNEIVVPNGIALAQRPTPADRERARGALGLHGDEFAIGIVARLSPQKAHEVLFAAFARVVAAFPDAKLVVIGQGRLDDELHTLARRLGISGRTLFTGLRRDVTDLLPGLDVSCLSSVHEAMPMTVIESMAAGLPVVVTDCGCLAEMVDDGEQGYVVPVADPGALAERLIRLAGDQALRRRMGADARARAEHRYRIERTVRGYTDMLCALVGHGGPPPMGRAAVTADTAVSTRTGETNRSGEHGA